jgi:hypothetical protein
VRGRGEGAVGGGTYHLHGAQRRFLLLLGPGPGDDAGLERLVLAVHGRLGNVCLDPQLELGVGVAGAIVGAGGPGGRGRGAR